MKKGDIIKYTPSVGNTYTARVNWADDENVGVTLTGAGSSGSEAAVLPISSCTLVTEYKGDENKKGMSKLTDDELRASIERLKGMRFPRKMATRIRKKSPSKRSEVAKTMEALSAMGVNSEEDINVLIARALKGEK